MTGYTQGKPIGIFYRVVCYLVVFAGIALSAGVAEAQSCVSPPPNLLSWWPGDGNADDIIGGHGGTLQGGATFVDGKVGQAFSLDGLDDFVDFGTEIGNFGTDDFTFDFWVYFRAPASEEVLIEKYIETFDGSRTGWGLAKITDTLVRLYGPVSSSTASLIDAGVSITADTWIHVAVTRSSGTFVLYWDGVPVGSQTHVLNLDSTISLNVGSRGGPDSREFFLNGLIDEIGIYDRALTAEEIEAIFNAGNAGKCRDGLVIPPEVKLSVLSASIGSPISLPVQIERFPSVGAVTLKIAYDESVLSFTGLASNIPGVEFLGSASAGLLSIAWADLTAENPINLGDGTLLNLHFDVVGNEGSSTTLDFTSECEIADAEGNPVPGVHFTDGSLTVVSGFGISGTVSYYANGLPVPAAQLSLAGDSSQVLNSSPDGTYAFSDLATGTYAVTPSKSTDLGGVNATDALNVILHTASLEPFADPNQLIAGDVNSSGETNSTDALKIVRYTAGLEPLPSGDWVFVPDRRDYDPLNADTAGQDYTGIRMGDVNGSWTPDGGAAKPVPVAGEARITIPDLTTHVGADLEIPIRIEGQKGIGAMTLFLAYPSDMLAFKGLEGFSEDIVAGQVKGVLRLVWVDLTGSTPVQLNSDPGPSLRLKFKVLGTVAQSGAIDILAGTELADGAGRVIPIEVWTGAIGISNRPGEYALSENYPNPFNPNTQIRYQIPEAGKVSLVVYNIHGQAIQTLIQSHQDAGYYQVTWDGRDDRGREVSSGVYLYRFVSQGLVQTNRMLLLK